MAHTYSASNLTDRNKVRLRIGDTKSQNWSLDDGEVDEALTLNSNVDKAAVIAHEWFLIRLANYISTSAGGQGHQLQQRFDMHEKLHKRLVVRANAKGKMSCFAGGISQSRIVDAKDDSDYPQPFARVGGDDRDYEPTDPTRDT